MIRNHAQLGMMSKNPSQATPRLQVGTADANATAANSVSKVRFTSILGNTGTPADEADVAILADINDVFNRPPNTAPLTDYTGEVGIRVGLQLTDRSNGSVPQDPATVADFITNIAMPCSPSPDPATGSSCVLSTTADTLVPGTVKESARAIWQLGQVEVTDGGAVGASATLPNSTFMRQGVFVP